MSKEHKLCMIPGPIEFSDAVLNAMSLRSTSHIDPSFIETFGHSLELLRKVFLTNKAQPFILSGSGVLGWDIVASNLVEKDDDVLVLSTGVFGDRFKECFECYGSKPHKINSEIGSTIPLSRIEEALKEKKYKLVTITHVDTSTGVLSDVKAISELVHQIQPEALVIVDAVCSAAAEEIRFDEWGLDAVLTASQKAIGVPSGLCLFVLSQKALNRYETRNTPVPNYYCDLKNWLPIMKAYESRQPSYFATPAVQLINALNVSLQQILNYSMESVFSKHREVALEFREQVEKLGLQTVTTSKEAAAHTMTTIYYPESINGAELLKAISGNGVVLAGGLHPDIKTKYFRIGHMGLSAMENNLGHVNTVLDVLKKVLSEKGFISKI